MNFGQWVRSWLELLGVNQAWFYFVSGISDGSINRWEKGQTVGIDLMVVSCEVLAVEAGMGLLEMFEDALSSIPAYRYALERMYDKDLLQ
jgi:hypothetical protein